MATFPISGEIPDNAIRKCYLWNRYRYDIPIDSIEFLLYSIE